MISSERIKKADEVTMPAGRFVGTVEKEGTLAFAAEEFKRLYGGTGGATLSTHIINLESLVSTDCTSDEIESAIDGILEGFNI